MKKALWVLAWCERTVHCMQREESCRTSLRERVWAGSSEGQSSGRSDVRLDSSTLLQFKRTTQKRFISPAATRIVCFTWNVCRAINLKSQRTNQCAQVTNQWSAATHWAAWTAAVQHNLRPLTSSFAHQQPAAAWSLFTMKTMKYKVRFVQAASFWEQVLC